MGRVAINGCECCRLGSNHPCWAEEVVAYASWQIVEEVSMAQFETDINPRNITWLPLASSWMFCHWRALKRSAASEQVMNIDTPSLAWINLESANTRKIAWPPPAIAWMNVSPSAIACMFCYQWSLECSTDGDYLHVPPSAIAWMFCRRRSIACMFCLWWSPQCFATASGWRLNNNSLDHQVAKYSIHLYLFHASPP